MSAAFGILAVFGLIVLLSIGLGILTIVAMWILYDRAGKPGWAAIVPVYNVIVMLEITGKPTWWILLILIPFVGIVFYLIVHFAFMDAFGQGILMSLLSLIVPWIIFPMMAFGGAVYDPDAAEDFERAS